MEGDTHLTESVGRVDIKLSNSRDIDSAQRRKLDKTKIREMSVSAIINNGARKLCINERVKEQLGLPVMLKAVYCFEGIEREVDEVGPVEIQLGNRRITAAALVLPETTQVLLGDSPRDRLTRDVEPPLYPLDPCRNLNEYIKHNPDVD